ncbi:MAG: MgtC/SapB family protein [Lachnospiraceae bacterium]|nr:MgtC/SapB family protein [Lachnospiraceae bacterium]
MNFSYYLFTQYSTEQHIEFCVRLFVACIVGGLIGIERSRLFKEAGVRTHIIVCCTTALIMILSKYGFADLATGSNIVEFGSKGTDPSRIAAQAVSGISFLCAGVIFKNGNNTVKGLTTAAGIWLTAGLGLTIGAGMYTVSAFAFLLIYLMQLLMNNLNIGSDAYSGYNLTFDVENDKGFNDALIEQLDRWKAKTVEHEISWQKDGISKYNLFILKKEELRYEDLLEFVKSRDDVIAFSTNMVKNKLH